MLTHQGASVMPELPGGVKLFKSHEKIGEKLWQKLSLYFHVLFQSVASS
jgi:hypothetical protein